ncbi:MAG: hypothetical protein AAGG72_06555, partial [Pseudomonadota bacterium]
MVGGTDHHGADIGVLAQGAIAIADNGVMPENGDCPGGAKGVIARNGDWAANGDWPTGPKGVIPIGERGAIGANEAIAENGVIGANGAALRAPASGGMPIAVAHHSAGDIAGFLYHELCLEFRVWAMRGFDVCVLAGERDDTEL